ncbi:hypothetical protein NDY24_22070 [Xanthomonas hortorum pv. pelargonii]|nr:hypothetical protein NDY24_22070 [Xanthomonas hortorum pv. pelargonii]
MHDSAHEWQGVSTGEYPIAPADMWAPPAWNPYPTGTASSHHQALQKRAQEWANLTTTTLQHDGKDPRLAQAITHLFLIFADSPTFRQTMATIQKEGMVGIRIDPEVATAHFNPQQREVVLGEMMARDPTTAMGVLAFELSNASLDLAFKECERNAAIAQLSPANSRKALKELNTIPPATFRLIIWKRTKRCVGLVSTTPTHGIAWLQPKDTSSLAPGRRTRQWQIRWLLVIWVGMSNSTQNEICDLLHPRCWVSVHKGIYILDDLLANTSDIQLEIIHRDTRGTKLPGLRKA